VLLSFAALASAQCPLPDRLDGPPGSCCTVTAEQLPVFPAFQLGSMGICWKDCGIDQVAIVKADWTAPTPAPPLPGGSPFCSVYYSKLKLYDTSGNLIWSGVMRMWYARTWGEIGTSGAVDQVWRFLVNGDLVPTSAAGSPPCPVPPCAASFGNRVRFTGYIDYCMDCSTPPPNSFSYAWMLNHECDRLDHRAGYGRAGTFHKNRSYTFVGPSAGFVPNPSLPVEAGPILAEDVRVIDLPIPAPLIGQCYFEEPLLGGTITPQTQICLCKPSSSIFQYSVASLALGGACGTVVNNGGQFPKRFVSKAIGSWTNPLVFPGTEDLRWNMGGYVYTDCRPLTRNDACYGVTTMGGWPALAIDFNGLGAPLPPTFIDQGNSLAMSLNTTMNVPYFSDHILNLNLP